MMILAQRQTIRRMIIAKTRPRQQMRRINKRHLIRHR
jgi:hypothetical protein